MIKSERFNVVPFEMKYLNHYFNGFNAEITKFQWPDPFESIEDARATLQEFLNEMDREETLLFSILSKDGDFLGSVEVHGLTEDYPELGIWIIKSEQNKGIFLERGSSPNRKLVEVGIDMRDCIFCKILDESVPCMKIYEDDHIIPRRKTDGIDAWPKFGGAKEEIAEIWENIKL